MNKNILLVAIIIIAIVIAGFMFAQRNDDGIKNDTEQTNQDQSESMGTDSTQPSETTTPPVSNDNAMSSEETKIKTFTIVGSNFKFAPNEIKVNKGDTVKVIFKSQGKLHDFVIDEFKVKTAQLGEDKSEEVTFVADKTGTFEFYCSVGEHREMGMKGSLIVQ
jgi:plastocyanin